MKSPRDRCGVRIMMHPDPPKPTGTHLPITGRKRAWERNVLTKPGRCEIEKRGGEKYSIIMTNICNKIPRFQPTYNLSNKLIRVQLGHRISPHQKIGYSAYGGDVPP